MFDEVDKLSFDRAKNDMVITRYYGNKTETTIIDNYFKRNLDNVITVTSPDFSQVLNADLAGLTMEITCKYPPIDVPVYVDWTAVCPGPGPEEPVAVWTCQYPPGNSGEGVPVDEVNQQVCAWQSEGADSVCYETPSAADNVDVTLIMNN